jgi:tetratricopeptide (TPR) repeat protein
MTQDPVAPAFRYRAFISYSHQDKTWADWLHKALETYAVPKRLVGQTTAAGVIPKRLMPIFRDRDELASAHDLGRKVNDALGQSASLIVVCSPRSAVSHWVQEEVLAYKRLGRSERIFCLIVDGEPDASDLPGREGEECLAPALRFQLDADGQLGAQRTEPIAADARPARDGKTNAKLKLIAGMLDVGFDALKQRELRRRARRVTAVAGFGLLGTIVMAIFAGVAVHERNIALNQRQQAEDLVGFMLGNLRTKLEAVSRLDILDDVADHALRYFEAQPDAGDIGSREKRAEAFLLLGRVRLDQGKVDDARHAFNQSLRISRDAAAGNSLPALQLAIVDAQFWLGNAAWQRGETKQALAYFQAALPIVTAVTNAHPDDEKALQRLAWMHTNLGHVFEAQGAWASAMTEYMAELRVSQRMASNQPRNRPYQRDVAVAHDNIAALLAAHGKFDSAEQHYLAERAVLEKLVAEDPRDADTTGQLAIAQSFLAQVAESLGHTGTARDNLRQAKAIGETALASDPGNVGKIGDLASYCRRLARNFRLAGETSAAAPLLERAVELYEQMLGKTPDSVRGQYGLAATQLEQARLAWSSGDTAMARARALDARQAFTALLHAQDYDRDAGLGLANTHLLQGRLDQAAGDAKNARAQWSQALKSLNMSSGGSQEPDRLSARAETLTLLGRVADAKPLISQLDAMHYRDPSFIAWRPTNTPTASTPNVVETASRAKHQ